MHHVWMQSSEERDAAWEEANKALMDDMPITALYYPSFVALVNEDQVENVELTLGNSFMFSHAEIDMPQYKKHFPFSSPLFHTIWKITSSKTERKHRCTILIT